MGGLWNAMSGIKRLSGNPLSYIQTSCLQCLRPLTENLRQSATHFLKWVLKEALRKALTRTNPQLCTLPSQTVSSLGVDRSHNLMQHPRTWFWLISNCSCITIIVTCLAQPDSCKSWDRKSCFFSSCHWRSGHYRAMRRLQPVIHWPRRSGNFWVRREVTGHRRTRPRRSNSYYNFKLLFSHYSNNCDLS